MMIDHREYSDSAVAGDVRRPASRNAPSAYHGGVSLPRPPQLLVSKFSPFSIMSAKNHATAVYEN